MTRNKKKFGQKLEDRRAEYTALRAEILQADRTCLLMMGYIFAAVGFLYANDSEWLVSLLSFVGLCYFTEKRFNIRLISTHIAEMGGFEWDKKIVEFRKKRQLRPFQRLRPYNVEALTCLFVALSPLFNGISDNVGKLVPDLWNYYLELSHDFDNSNISNLGKLNLWGYFNLLIKKFLQLNLDFTFCFWLIFLIFTLVYSLYGLHKYNFHKADKNEKKAKSKLMKMYPTMRHPSRYVWDFWYYHDPDTKLFHVFYLNADESLVPSEKHHFASRVGYATTYDFIRMDWGDESSFDILQPPLGHWANTSIWSGDIIKIKNGYLFFFTSRDRNQDDEMTQNIGVAHSNDNLSAKNWTIFNTRIQPQSHYQPRSVKHDLSIHAWRDPFLFRDQEHIYMMLSAKSNTDCIGRNGVVGLLRTNTNDFPKVVQGNQKWEYLYPLLQPSCYSEMEVPQLYKDSQDNYELVFSTWKEKDLAPTTKKAGGLQGITLPQTWDFNLDQKSSIAANPDFHLKPPDFHVLMPESHGLYACRIIPELGGEIVGFDIHHGGIRRSGVKTNFEAVERDFSDLSI